jgi:hypothetical protein
LRAAATLLEVELRGSDRALVFSVNHPDGVCLLNSAVFALQGVVRWPVFVGDPADAQAVADWFQAEENRKRIDAFAFDVRESLQVYVNCVSVVVEPVRNLGEVVDQIIELVEHLPLAQTTGESDWASDLPEDLRHLHTFFDEWAIADDEEREERVARSRKGQLARLRRAVEPLLPRIDAYLDSFAEPMPECAIHLARLAELVAELRARDA